MAGLVQGQSNGLFVVSTSATITVTEDGAVKGVTYHGIQYAGGGSFTLNNKGTIAGGGYAIVMASATSTLTNSGNIFGGIFQAHCASNDTLTNSGRIDGDVSLFMVAPTRLPIRAISLATSQVATEPTLLPTQALLTAL